MVFQARGPSLMAALGPGVGICGRPGGLKKKVVLREMDVESKTPIDPVFNLPSLNAEASKHRCSWALKFVPDEPSVRYDYSHMTVGPDINGGES